MNEHRYRAYYEFDGPTSSLPNRAPKSEADVRCALETLVDQLNHAFGDDADVEVGPIEPDAKMRPSRLFVIVTLMPASASHEVVATCLDALDLYGDALS